MNTQTKRSPAAQALIDKARELEIDALRYRHLRNAADNKIMRKLMNESSPRVWDELVDADIAALKEGSR